MTTRRYLIIVREPDGVRRFHRTSPRSLRDELRLLWDEHPEARRIEIEPKAPVRRVP